MADIVIDPTKVRAVDIFEQLTMPVDEAVAMGQAVRYAGATGRFTKSNGTNAGESKVRGISIQEATLSGQTVTAVKRGIIDLGRTALAGLDYGAPVYLSDTDGVLADAAGTVSVIVGHVMPGNAQTTPDKLLFVDIPGNF